MNEQLDRIIPPQHRPVAIAVVLGACGLLVASCCCGTGAWLLSGNTPPTAVLNGGRNEWLAASYADQMQAAELLVREKYPRLPTEQVRIRAHIVWADAQLFFTVKADDGSDLWESSLRELMNSIESNWSDKRGEE